MELAVSLFDVLPGAEPGRVGCSRVLSKGDAENGEHTGWAEPCKPVAGASAGGRVGALPTG